MINNLFYSQKNIDVIKSIINEKVNTKNNNNFDLIINETMNYVSSQVSSTPPKGVKEEEYLFLMNKKVYDTVLPLMKKAQIKKVQFEKIELEKKTIEIENKKVYNENKRNDIENNIFDPLLLRNFENPAIIEYPKPSINKITNESIDSKIKYLENERSTLTPKIRPIDFTIKSNDDNKSNTLELFNNLLITNQKNIDINNDNSSTSIDLLLNNKPTNLEFSEVSVKSNNIILNEPEFNLIEKIFYVIFDSADRDLYEYPNPTNFQVKFSPTGNNYRYESYYDNYGTLILLEKTVVYGDGSKLSVNEIFDNVYKIKCSSCIFPVTPLNININNSSSFQINIFREPYLFLVIPELRGPYRGGNLLTYNSFSKLMIDYSSNTSSTNTNNDIIHNRFTVIKPSTTDEAFIYEPVSAGKIDKMSLNLLNKNGRIFNVGVDKLYIKGFSQGTDVQISYCGGSYLSTLITIQNINDEYIKYCSLYQNNGGSCNLLNTNPIGQGDVIYFYDTTPSNDQVVFFESYINVSKIKYSKKNNEIIIYLNYKKIIDGDEKVIDVNIQNIINQNVQDYYFIIVIGNKYYYLKISSVTNNSIIVNYLETLPQLKNYSQIKIGIAKNNPAGSNNSDIGSLFNINGYTVINIFTDIENYWNVEIDFPYKNLPEYFKNSNNEGEIFIIQQKLQITYTFEITTKIKDYGKLNSKLNESGSN